ncbi:enkurin [Drosophila bipectinata]|uniref:enkurin n=1 Tax=Drosophila bipectinata TaxID=42026 RepID=UPI0007E77DAE|nr:enkurin [Drosophila bipectinata]
MSLVYITHHDENILECEQDFVKASGPKESFYVFRHPIVEKAARYARGVRDRLNIEDKKLSMIVQKDGTRVLTEAKKSLHRTMGCAHTPIDPPCAYLRKNQGIKWRRERDHVCPKTEGMPPLPRPGSCHKKGMTANFIKRNRECAGQTIPCPPPPRVVDTPVGTRQNLMNSGLVPQFICRKDFGKVPVYLKKTKKLLAEMNAICAKEQQRLLELCRGIKGYTRAAGVTAAAAAAAGPPEMPGMRVMDQAERNEILEGLRMSLTEMTKQYQSMSLLIDNIAKRQRKSKLEHDLRQVEQDILLIETTPIIYVSQY